MTIKEGRPPDRTIRIEDCSSVKVFDNPSPRCPHGKNWRESDYDKQPSNIKALMCPQDGCEAIEYHPHAGKHIVVRVPRSFKERQPLTDLYAEAVTAGFSQVSIDAFGRRVSVQDRLREIISNAVQGWDWEDKDGNELPLPAADWDAVVSVLEQPELWWIIRAMLSGGDPDTITQGN